MATEFGKMVDPAWFTSVMDICLPVQSIFQIISPAVRPVVRRVDESVTVDGTTFVREIALIMLKSHI